MKKLAFALSAFLLLGACRKDENKQEEVVNDLEAQYEFSAKNQEVKESLVTIVTRTECGACGEYGHPTFDGKINTENQVNGLALHFRENDVMYSEAASSWVGRLGWQATPSFGVGLTKQDADVQDWENAISQDLSENVTASLGISGSGEGEMFDIDVNVMFYSDFQNATSVALYILEDEFVAEQEDYGETPSTVEDYIHNQIMRKSVTSVWGESLGTNFTANEQKSKSYSFKSEEVNDVKQMKLIAVLFELDGNGNPVNVINSRTAEIEVIE